MKNYFKKDFKKFYFLLNNSKLTLGFYIFIVKKKGILVLKVFLLVLLITLFKNQIK